MLILSVDPGLTGALAWLERKPDGGIHLLAVADIPTVKAKVNGSEKAHVNLPELAALMGLTFNPSAVIIEDVSAAPGQGVTSTFRFGQVKGQIEGVAAALRYPIHYMRPSEWQRPATVLGKGDDASRLAATRLFPNNSQYFARKMDHNRADAALIGYAFLKTR